MRGGFYLNILVAFDRKYMPHTKVMLASLRASMPNEKIDVYYLYNEMPQDVLERLKNDLREKENIEFHPIKIDKTPFDGIKIGMHFTIEIMYRLMAVALLPESVDRVLWLDGDIIINHSIAELYNVEFNGATIAACKGRGLIENHNRRLDLPKEHIYFNSGVLLMNLKKMRENDALKQFIDIMNSYGDRLTFVDQDILNISYTGEDVIYFNSEIYNCQIGRDFKLDKVQYKAFIENCCVMHFAAAAKPWNNTYINGMEKLYWKYALKDRRYMEYVRFMLFAPVVSAYKRFRIRNMKQYDF